ncbi:MAG: hypothetical protein RR868_03275 [Muribaculaceae bacterium]
MRRERCLNVEDVARHQHAIKDTLIAGIATQAESERRRRSTSEL